MSSMLPLALIALLLFLPAALCSSSFSPAPAPARGSDDVMAPDAPPPYLFQSPPAPPPHTNDSPASSPSPTAAPASSSAAAPAPGRGTMKDVSVGDDEGEETAEEGMSGGQKAGVAIGVVAGAGAVGLAGFVYKKRQENTRRARYGYVARQMI